MESSVQIHPHIETKFHFGYSPTSSTESGNTIRSLERKKDLTKLENYEKVYLQNSLRLYYLYRKYYPFYYQKMQKIKGTEAKQYNNIYHFLLFLTNPKLLQRLEADITILPTVLKAMCDVIGAYNPHKQIEIEDTLQTLYHANIIKYEKVLKETKANPSDTVSIFEKEGLGGAMYGKVICAKEIPKKMKLELLQSLLSQSIVPNTADLEMFLQWFQIENYTFEKILCAFDVNSITFDKNIKPTYLQQKKEMLVFTRQFLQSISTDKLLYPDLFYIRMVDWFQIETDEEYQLLLPEYPYSDLLQNLEHFDKHILQREKYKIPKVPKILKK